VLDTLRRRTSRKRSKNGGDGGTGVCMWEGTTSRVMAADRPCGEFYDFYSVSSEYFGYTLLLDLVKYKLPSDICEIYEHFRILQKL
jgi:hypothetical protein